MRCFFCKGDVVSGTTTYVEDLGDRVVIIRNVPCEKCAQCGEAFINGDVALRLEQIVDSFRQAMTEVAIVSYSAA